MFQLYGRGSCDRSLQWQSEFGVVFANGSSRKRRLVFEPSAHRPDIAMLYAWVEEEQGVVQWTVPAAQRHPRPKGAGYYTSSWVQLKPSHRAVPITNSFGGLLLRALSKQELVGESASLTMFNMFWDFCVETDAGLAYLYKWAGNDFANHYIRERLDCYDASKEKWKRKQADLTAQAIVTATRDKAPLSGLIACQRLEADTDFRAATEAICMMGGDEERRSETLLKFICEQASPKAWCKKVAGKR